MITPQQKEILKQKLREAASNKGSRLHVITRGKKWAVRKTGAKRALRLVLSKEQAIIEAKKRLVPGSDIVVHTKKGSVERIIRHG